MTNMSPIVEDAEDLSGSFRKAVQPGKVGISSADNSGKEGGFDVSAEPPPVKKTVLAQSIKKESPITPKDDY